MGENNRASGFLSGIRLIPELNAEYALEVIGNSEELYKTMLLQFLRLLPSHIDDMDNALIIDDLNTFAVKAHGLKGSLRQIGNLNLALTGESLEKAAKANNPNYCHENYKDFRDGLLCFYTQINAALDDNGVGTDTGNKPGGDIHVHADTLARVKDALEDYDSLLAADILAPLMKTSFGTEADGLITQTAEALASFQPQKALEYINELISGIECSKPYL